MVCVLNVLCFRLPKVLPSSSVENFSWNLFYKTSYFTIFKLSNILTTLFLLRFFRSHPFPMFRVASVSQFQGLFHHTWKGVIEQRFICSYYVTTFLILLVYFKIYEPSDLQIKTFIGMYYCVVERIRSNSELLKVVEYV